ncbi:MAG: hypothetical protein NTV63_02595 [Candidatus Woesearchaeota archaeon]|nr:hypothetical protein [Candidatus Woesearchaeota archaeon]
MKMQIMVSLLVFLLGWFCSSLYSELSQEYYMGGYSAAGDSASELTSSEIGLEGFPNPEIAKSSDEPDKNTLIEMLLGEPITKQAPADRISESQIYVFNDKIIINLKNAEWASFTPTHSMEPVLNENSNAIEIVPVSEDEIKIGDIISYESEYAEGTIIHRVAKIGNDENGWYCIAKGDNNPSEDPGRIRFSQIRRVVVAIIY